mgnify:CR=1 FL=1
MPPEIVRWMLLFKVCGLIRGHSGVQPQTVDRLVDFFNEGLIPVVPRQGSLGASGDLAPLSHMCLPLMGEGELMERNAVGAWTTRSAAEVLQSAGFKIDIKCSDGICGVCKCGVLEGEVEHRDYVLSKAQRSDHIISCQSRAAQSGGKLVLDL